MNNNDNDDEDNKADDDGDDDDDDDNEDDDDDHDDHDTIPSCGLPWREEHPSHYRKITFFNIMVRSSISSVRRHDE